MRVMVLRMNNKKPPFDNLNFRLAMSHAFNYKGFIDGVLKGYAVRNPGPIPFNLWGAPKDLAAYDLNVDKAKEFLAKAKVEGAPVDREIEINIQEHLAQTTQAAQILQQGCRKVGINLKIVPNLWPQLIASTARATRRPTCGCIGCRPISSIRRTGSVRCTTASSTARGKRPAGTRTTRSTASCARRRGLEDQGKRQSLYEEASRIVVADAADIWIYNAIELRGLSNRVRGFHFTPIGSGADFRSMSLVS